MSYLSDVLMPMENSRYELDETHKEKMSEIINKLEMYDNNGRTDINENNNYKFDVLRRLKDYSHTLMINELTAIMNIRTDDEKLAYLKSIRSRDKKIVKDIKKLESMEYINQLSHIKDWLQLEKKQMVGIKFATRITESEWLRIYNIYSSDKKKYLHQREQFRCIKNAFLKFEVNLIMTNYNLFFDTESEKVNTQMAYSKLENRTYDLWEIENVILKQMKVLMSPEASYLILTWLSPSAWKKRYNIGKLKYEFAVSDIEVHKKNNKQRYLNYAWDKTLEGFLEEVQVEPVLKMYWKSAEQFDVALTRLTNKTIQKMKVLDMIWNLRSNKNVKALAVKKQPYNYRKRKAKKALKHKLISMRHKIAEMIRKKTEEDFEYLKYFTHNQTFLNVRSMLQNICREQEYTLYGYFSKPYRIFGYLTAHLADVLEECSKISTIRWNMTDKILLMMEARSERKARFKKTMFNAIKTTVHRTTKIYEELPENRKEKLIPFRSQVPVQVLPRKPKSLTLNDEQMMYMKCLTYLPLYKVDEYVSIMPELKID